jgi:eukaryotic-like serine/threonine-protein kinase
MNGAGAERLIRGRYRLGTVLGRGGMGVVWQAHDELLSRDVAVKELVWPAHISEEERQAACRRATREAQVAARLSHRNVVRVYDVVEEDGRPWIVTELLPPSSLRDLIKHEGPLGPARAARIGLDILAALRAAHAAGVLHLDVKPANIMIDGDRAVLTDFGIARDMGLSAATTAGLLIGSPSYIAPERARGGRPGPAADLWGLGASLYAAVEGRGPFDREGGALASLTAAVADEAEPALHAGPLLWPVISGLLRKDPNERLGAATAGRMLRRVAHAPAVAAAPPAVAAAALAAPEAPRSVPSATVLSAPKAPRSVPSATVLSAPRAPRSVLSAAAHISPSAPKARRSVLSAAALAIVASGISAGIALSSSPHHATAAGWPAAASTHPKAPGGIQLSGRPQQAAPVRSGAFRATGAASRATGAASGRAAAAKHGPGIQTESLLSTTPHAKALGHGHGRHVRRPGPSSGPKHAKGKDDGGSGKGPGHGSRNISGVVSAK